MGRGPPRCEHIEDLRGQPQSDYCRRMRGNTWPVGLDIVVCMTCGGWALFRRLAEHGTGPGAYEEGRPPVAAGLVPGSGMEMVVLVTRVSSEPLPPARSSPGSSCMAICCGEGFMRDWSFDRVEGAG